MKPRSSLRSRIAPLAFGMGLALVAQISDAAADEPLPHRERIEQLWIDAAGTSGVVETSPLYLDGSPATVSFGPAACGRSHRIGEPTLQVLLAAAATGQPVRLDTEPSSDGKVRCVSGVAVFAPLP